MQAVQTMHQRVVLQPFLDGITLDITAAAQLQLKSVFTAAAVLQLRTAYL